METTQTPTNVEIMFSFVMSIMTETRMIPTQSFTYGRDLSWIVHYGPHEMGMDAKGVCWFYDRVDDKQRDIGTADELRDYFLRIVLGI